MDLISLEQARQLIGVSRPTLNLYRKKHGLKESRVRGRTYLSKTEVIKKILLPEQVQRELDLTLLAGATAQEIQPLPGVFDLRRLKSIDACGVITLLCAIKWHLRQDSSNDVHLLVDGSTTCAYLASIGFFQEAERASQSRVFFDRSAIVRQGLARSAVILPLHLIGYRGAEKRILDELYDPLFQQGFSEEYCGHIGWIIGELCDNAHTHSNGPCYLVIEALSSQSGSTDTRFLSISVGDIGVGIPASLRMNPKYETFSDGVLFLMAFLSKVSRMDVIPERGKGLSDVASIAIGNGSWLRVDSGGLGLFLRFTDPGRSVIERVEPTLPIPGTRFSLVLIDKKFTRVSRAEADRVIQTFIRSEEA